jgi:hypothetical protein
MSGLSRNFLLDAALAVGLVLAPQSVVRAEPAAKRFDHVYVIVLENRDFDEAIDARDAPFLNELSRTQGLATRYYGVAHPSLPNYLAMIGGDSFFIRDDDPSCFASDLKRDRGQACHEVVGETLVDQLEKKGLTFALYAQGLQGAGDLAQGHPDYPRHEYAQKHNPFAYYETIATNKERLSRLKPMTELDRDLEGEAPSFAFIVPDQCHDGHGLRGVCDDPSKLAHDYDAMVAELVHKIQNSKNPHNWTENSAIVVTFDEGEMHGGVAAAKPEDENRVATIVVAKCGAARVSAELYSHYSLLATFEDGFGLPRLRKADKAAAMFDLFDRPCP